MEFTGKHAPEHFKMLKSECVWCVSKYKDGSGLIITFDLTHVRLRWCSGMCEGTKIEVTSLIKGLIHTPTWL